MAVYETNDEYENIPATTINKIWVNEEVKGSLKLIVMMMMMMNG